MSKFTPINLGHFYNRSDETLAVADGQSHPWHPDLLARLDLLPAGEQSLWGIPFVLAPMNGARWLELFAPSSVTIPVTDQATYLVVTHFCNASVDAATRQYWPGIVVGSVTRPGEHLADYVLVYANGSEHRQPIRRRFEINEPLAVWGQRAFAARPHVMDAPVDWRGPHPRNEWGRAQMAVRQSNLPVPAHLWIYALPNPHPDKSLTALRLEPTGADRLAIAGLTLYHAPVHPLRHSRLAPFRVTLPSNEAALPENIYAEIDLGIIARKYAVPLFEPKAWLESDLQGWGEQAQESHPTTDLRLDIAASPAATLKINQHAIDLGAVYASGGCVSSDVAARVEILSREKTWVHVTVADLATGKPTPTRIHFRTPDGHYVPPYGHRHEVNDNWFEDYGADLKLGSTEYAYVDGRFQIELPVGEVYVEAVKGFEYQPLRQRVTIRPGQRELQLKLERPLDWRTRGWVTADTHVHFISPQTAWLEAQAEGVNLVNLLASQWGDLFTNVGDLSGELSGVSTGDTLVWVGTENRQHML